MDMLNIPKKMKNVISDYKMNLLEIRKSGSMVFNNIDVKNVFDLVRKIYDAEFSKINELYNNIDLNPEVGIAVGSITNNQKLVRHALSIKEKGGQFNMCSALEKLEEQNYERGVQEGQQETAALFTKVLTEAEKKNVKVNYSKLQDMKYI